jgi:hypothetical protein
MALPKQGDAMKKRTTSFAYTKHFQRLNAKAATLLRAGNMQQATVLSAAVRAAHRQRAIALRGW